MFGETITITIDGNAKELNRINQDNYSSEYLLRETTGAYGLKVRHSKEAKAVRGEPMDRHNVELSYTFYGTSPDDGYTVFVSTTIRNPERIAGADVDKISDGLADWVKANAVGLTGWLS